LTSPASDPAQPAAARIYDYLLGGKDNYAVDRAAAEKVLAVAPDQRRRGHGRTARSGGGTPVETYFRPRHRILRFFDGFELLAPGLTDVQGWRQDSGAPTQLRIAGGVGPEALTSN